MTEVTVPVSHQTWSRRRIHSQTEQTGVRINVVVANEKSRSLQYLQMTTSIHSHTLTRSFQYHLAKSSCAPVGGWNSELENRPVDACADHISCVERQDTVFQVLVLDITWTH